MATEVYLVQHGVTDWNARRWSQGHADVPLNEAGRRQGEALAKRLGQEPLDAIYSSDLSRTAESVAPLARAQGLEVVADWRLREGRWQHHKARDPQVPVLPFPVESETAEDVLLRVWDFLRDVTRRHAGGRVLLMTHGSVVKRLVFRMEQTSDWPFPPYESRKMALNLFRLDGEKWEVAWLNDVEYLEAEGLDIGRRSRHRRRRVILHGASRLVREWCPTMLQPPFKALFRAVADRDRQLSLDPWMDMEREHASRGGNVALASEAGAE